MFVCLFVFTAQLVLVLCLIVSKNSKNKTENDGG